MVTLTSRAACAVSYLDDGPEGHGLCLWMEAHVSIALRSLWHVPRCVSRRPPGISARSCVDSYPRGTASRGTGGTAGVAPPG